MRSDSWDVSAIPKTGLGLGHVSHKNAESTHIHGYKSIEALKDDHLEEDVYMGSCSQESRGFRYDLLPYYLQKSHICFIINYT